MARKPSLAGLIEENWNREGRPILGWNELLQRAVAADQELERLGYNPAEKFRILRIMGNSSGMLGYIARYYRYAFCPNHQGSKDIRTPDSAAAFARPSSAELLNIYRHLKAEHPHDLLPLETALPKELGFSSRDKYRVTLTMILSQGMRDLHLSGSLVNLFSRLPNFASLETLTKEDIRIALSSAGFGLNDPDGASNGARLWGFKESYFKQWRMQCTPQLIHALRAEHLPGFGNKFVSVVEGYCFGSRNVFPLDRPAFRVLQELGIYQGHGVDEARNDVEKKLRTVSEVSLIDFHELLRFRGQAGRVVRGRLSTRQRSILTGWNGWRILCSIHRRTFDKNWIFRNFVKEQHLSERLAFYSHK